MTINESAAGVGAAMRRRDDGADSPKYLDGGE